MNARRVSQSVLYQVLNAGQLWCVVFKKTWRNNISFKKETEKIVLLQVIQIIVRFRTEKYLSTFLSPNTNILLRGTH